MKRPTAKADAGRSNKPPGANAPGNEPESEALRHGRDAFGARFIEPGFAFTERDDLCFALGYPHLFFHQKNHPNRKQKDLLKAHELGPVLPDELVHFYMQYEITRVVAGSITDPNRRLRPAFKKAFERVRLEHPTIGVADLPELARLFLKDPNFGALGGLLRPAEAIHGPEAPTEVALGILEEATPAQLRERHVGRWTAAAHVALARLRLPVKAADACLSRVEAVWRRAHAKKATDYRSALAPMDVMLHGTKGALRSGQVVEGRLSQPYLILLLDNADFVAKHVVQPRIDPEVPPFPDARLAFLGGEPVLKFYADAWKCNKYEHDQYVQQLGKVRSEHVAAMMLEMTAVSKAKQRAAGWFEQHADYALPLLERAAKGKGERAKWAAPLLKRLTR